MPYDLNWGLIVNGADPARAAAAGFQQGREMRRQQSQDNALAALAANPSDPSAVSALSEANPQLGLSYQNNALKMDAAATERADRALRRQAIDLIPDVLEGYGVGSPGGASGTPSNVLAGALTAPQTNALVSVSGSSPSPTDLVVQAPKQHHSIADMYRLDPEVAGKLVPQIFAMQESHRKQLDYQADTMARAAYRLLQVPEAKREDALERFRTDLLQAGMTQQEVDDADLTDDGLHWYVTHSLGVKDAIAQHEHELSQTEAARHNRATEGAAAGNLALSRQREARVAKWGPQSVFTTVMPTGDGRDLDEKYGGK